MAKIKKDDEIIVIAGKDKGKHGKVLRMVEGKRLRVLVEGVNVAKKHMKPNPQLNQPGGIIDKEMPLDISNIALWNPVAKKADRAGYKVLEDGQKVRYFKSNNELVDI